MESIPNNYDPTETIKCAKRGCDWEGTEAERVTQTLDSIVSVTLCPKCRCDSYRVVTKPQENINAV